MALRPQIDTGFVKNRTPLNATIMDDFFFFFFLFSSALAKPKKQTMTS